MAVGQRLRVGDVEGEAQPPRVAHQGVGVGDRTASDVDEERAVGHGRQERVVDEVARGALSGTMTMTTSCTGSSRGELVDAVDRADEVVTRPGP